MKTEILVDFQICISVPLTLRFQTSAVNFAFINLIVCINNEHLALFY